VPETVTFGGATYPLPATPVGAIKSPVAVALLDFLAYYLNTSLNPQMALLYPALATAHPSRTVVPLSKRFAFDPKDTWPQLLGEPGAHTPLLFLWWAGSRSQPWSMLKDRVVSTYEFMWIGPQRQDPKGTAMVAGIEEHVDNVIRLAADRGWHPDYSYNSAPLGEPVHITLGFQGWAVADSSPGQMRPSPGSRRAGTEGAQIHHYPAVKAKIQAWKVVEQGTPQDPGDALGDSTFAIRTNGYGGIDDVVDFAEANLPGPDGSEDGDE
jgi:hypothetical protein